MLYNCCCATATVGAGGMGKTTMAMLLHNQLVHKFKHKAIVELHEEDSGGKLKEHLSGLLEDLGFQGKPKHSSKELQFQYCTFVKDKAVLLLIDNVYSKEQLDALLPHAPCFGPGSRVIITSRFNSMPTSIRDKVGVASTRALHCIQSGNMLPQSLTHWRIPPFQSKILPRQLFAHNTLPLLPQPPRCWHDA